MSLANTCWLSPGVAQCYLGEHGAAGEFTVRGGNVADAQLREICNGLSFFCVLDSSSEEEEEEDEEEEEEAEDYRMDNTDRLSSPALDESGLGLLARFAASAMPSPIVPPPLSIIQLEAKQKAKKKEERQSLMGELRGEG